MACDGRIDTNAVTLTPEAVTSPDTSLYPRIPSIFGPPPPWAGFNHPQEPSVCGGRPFLSSAGLGFPGSMLSIPGP